MKISNKLLKYSIWFIFSVLIALCCAFIEFEPNQATGNFETFLHELVVTIAYYVGSILGLCSFVVYVLWDYFYYKKREKKNNNLTFQLFHILLINSILYGILYLLEYVLDWI